MNRNTIIAAFFALVFFAGQNALAQSGHDLFQKGLVQERVKGDLDEAIKVYESILEKFPENRQIAAKALLHLGLCYEQLGATEAQKAYRRLIKDFADQPEIVARAQTRLSKLKYVTDKGAMAMSTRQVWAPALDTMGAPSPDGRYISHVNWNKGNLAVHDLETGENRDLTNDASMQGLWQFSDVSIWSPDSSQVAYCWISEDGTDLRIVGLDGSKPRILLRDYKTGYLWPRAWSNDGKHILGTFCNKGTAAAKDLGHIDRIGMVSVEDGSLRILKLLGKHRSKYMDFSPDDRYMVYDVEIEEDSGTYDIHLMTFDGSGETPLVVHPANDGAPFWTPDGKHIVFASDRTGSNALWILEVDEGKPKGDPTQVKGMGKEFGPMGFTADGSFYYSIEVSALDIYVTTLDFKAGKVLADPTKMSLRFEGSNLAPAWSPDGKYLSYLSRRSYDERVLVIRDVVTGKERDVLPKTNVQVMQKKYHLAPQWSLDGESILVTAVDNNRQNVHGLYLVNAETGNVTPIVRDDSRKEDDKYAAPFWPVFSKDGKRIYYVGDNKSVMVHNLETGAESELYRSTPRIYRLAISPDGQQLAFVEGASELQGCKVCTISTSGNQARELYTLKKTERGTWMVGLSWTSDGNTLVLGKTDNLSDKKTEIWMIPVKGGEPSKFELPVKANHVSLHPDGQRIAFTGGELGGNSEIWVLENFLPKSSDDK
jgi:Tol biopolymer transport system component